MCNVRKHLSTRSIFCKHDFTVTHSTVASGVYKLLTSITNSSISNSNSSVALLALYIVFHDSIHLFSRMTGGSPSKWLNIPTFRQIVRGNNNLHLPRPASAGPCPVAITFLS